MTTHELKTWPQFFGPVYAGEKTFEVRFDDRGYQRGDHLLLREWDPDVRCECRDTSNKHLISCARYTGRQIKAEVGFVTSTTPGRGSQRGFNGQGYVVLALVSMERSGEAAGKWRPSGEYFGDWPADKRPDLSKVPIEVPPPYPPN